MDVFKTFGNKDKDAIEDGKWFVIGKNARIKMRGLKSSASQAYRRKAMEPYANLINSGKPLPEGVDEELIKNQLVDVLILDWEGLEGNGEPLEYSKDAARKLVNEVEDFVDFLAQILTSDASFKAEVREEEEKN